MSFKVTIDINLKASEEVTNSLLTLAAVLNNSVPIFDETEKTIQDKISNHKSNQKTNLVDEKSNNIALTELRSLLSKISREGKQLEVKNLIKKFGGKKLTDIPKDKYEEMYKQGTQIYNLV